MSASKFCANCGSPVPPNGNNCPNCGAPVMSVGHAQIPQPQKPKNTLMIVLIAVVGLLVVVGVIVAILLIGKDKEKEQATLNPTEMVATTDTAATTTPTTPAPTAATESAPLPPPPDKPARRSSPFTYVVDGSIGKYKIEMDLDIGGGTLSGRYRYNRMNGKGGWLTLSGYSNGQSFTMSEYDSSGNCTGYFEGTYTISGDNLTMRGSMTNAKGTTYKFNVSGGVAGM